MKILLQFPEGLKSKAIEYTQKYSKEGHEIIVSSEPSYGACDVPISDAIRLKCDKIIHFGHSEYCKIAQIPVEYVPYEIEIDIEKLVDGLKPLISEYEKIGLITNLSHVKQIPEIKKELQKFGKIAITSKGSVRCNNEAQILGCDLTAMQKIIDQVDCVIYIGGGTFHALAPAGMEKHSNCPIFWTDPFTNKVEQINEKLDRIRKQRLVALAKASEAKVFGVLVSTKVGQTNVEVAEQIVEKINSSGKRAVIIVGNLFDFNSLNNFMEIECFINTACPRIIDDQNKLRVPIVNWLDYEKMISKV